MLVTRNGQTPQVHEAARIAPTAVVVGNVTIGAHTLVSPQCALVGCQVGAHCYLATQVMMFQGAQLGDGCRVRAGAIVHVNAHLPPGGRVGLRHIAAATPDGGVLITDDITAAHQQIAAADFVQTVLGSPATSDQRQEALHVQALARLHVERFSCTDERAAPHGQAGSIEP